MNQNAILIAHIDIQNANALSSPYTIGFPAMTAWLGAAHALQRQLHAKTIELADVQFTGVGVISHKFALQTYKGKNDFVSSIIGTANPLVPDTMTAKRPSIIEEARCHMQASIVITYNQIEAHIEKLLLENITHVMHANLKIAGGDITNFEKPEILRDYTKITKLMPGYALIERRDLVLEAMQQGQDAMDAMLDYLTIIHTSTRTHNAHGKEVVHWASQRKTDGWIVPIATGFQRIHPIGQAKNQRDPHTPHCFAESIITLGEFKMLHKVTTLEQLVWHYHTDDKKGLYLCQQAQSNG